MAFNGYIESPLLMAVRIFALNYGQATRANRRPGSRLPGGSGDIKQSAL
jgi:hypothetical protein